MKSGDDGSAGKGDERLDALVDEALREMASAGPVDLRPRVMAAWDERARREASAGPPGRRAERRPRLALAPLRPAVALAAVLVLVAAALFVWQQARQPGPAGQPAATKASRPATADPSPATPAPSPAERGQGGLAAVAGGSSPAERPASKRFAERRPGRRLVEVEFPVEQLTATLVSLPGAPAGEPGEGIGPLPGAPSIPIAPIGPAPTVSDMSRPVTDFPAGDSSQPQPGADHGDAGQSGGPGR